MTLRKRVEELKEVSRKHEALLKEIGNMQVLQLRKYEINHTSYIQLQSTSQEVLTMFENLHFKNP